MSDTMSNAEKEWSRLLREYHITLDVTAGCGARGQPSIDTAYAKLQAFVERNPEFAKRLPNRATCEDDGVGGFTGAMTAMARRAHEERKEGGTPRNDCGMM